MPSTNQCPSVEVLAQLALGKLPAALTETLSDHVGTCSECAHTFLSLPANDTLTDTMRQVPSAAVELPHGADVDRLIDQIRAISPLVTNDTLAHSPDEAAPADPLAGLRPPQAADEIGRLGGYRVLKVLGQGGMGAVLLGEDVALKRRVALKVMKPEIAANPSARTRFLREAQAAAAIRDDHVITIYQVGQDGETPFLAMELLQGESLDDRLRREGRLSVADVVKLGREMAHGLAAAHALGLIHRDIKPGNVWLETRGSAKSTGGQAWRVKILDFGLARATDSAGDNLTRTGAVVGTPAYMAPEQARSKPVDHRADLFSLGCVLYEAATGRRPFQGDDLIGLLSSLALDNPESPHIVEAEIPRPLSDLVMRLLAKDAADRPASAEAVANELANLGDVPEETTLMLTAPKPAPPRKRSRVGVGVAGGLLGLAVAVAVGVVVVIKDRVGNKVAEVVVPEGGTVEIKDDRSAKVAPPSPEPKKDAAKPFVLLRDGKSVRAFQTFAGAFADRQAGDMIEVSGNGPFDLPQLVVDARGLHVRAAAGFRPRFVSKPDQPVGQDLVAVRDGDLRLEGCDFHSPPREHRSFVGTGVWEILGCRLTTADGNNPSLLMFSGTRLTVERSVLVGGFTHGMIGIDPKAKAVFRDSLLFGGGHAVFGLGNGGQSVQLERCSVFSGGVAFSGFATTTDPIDLTVTGCAVEASLLLSLHVPRDRVKQLVRWQGEGNVYRGAGLRCGNEGNDFAVSSPADWQRFWGDTEKGGRAAAGPMFPFAAMDGPAERIFPVIAAWAPPAGTKAGPDWSVVGPGEAYVRAIAAEGKAVAKADLQPEPLEGGPVVLVRGNKPVRGFLTVAQAASAAEAGDVIELRTDRPTGWGTGKVPLTVRAAPGYRPVFAEGVSLAADGWSFEGIHFARGIKSAAARFVNCSGDPVEGTGSLEAEVRTDGAAVEVVRCLFPEIQITTAGGPVRVSRSAVGRLVATGAEAGKKAAVTLEQSLIGASSTAAAVRTNHGIDVRADGCVLMPMVLSGPKASFRWAGDRNVYLNGVPLRAWAWEVDALGVAYSLAEWRKVWGSDATSVEGPSPLLDPAMWKFTADGPAAGADVVKVLAPNP